MRCSLVRLLMAVMVLVLTNEARGFEHLKHKFKLKKLAKLAFAARFLPHLIPLPIPMPIIKRHRHKQTFKVIEESDPWRGQGWDMAEGWDFNGGQGGWNFEGGNGWQQMQGWQGQMALPEGWSAQQGFDGHFQKSAFQQHSIPSLKGGGDGDFGSGGQHSHQVEIREEIVPALKAAGFFGDPNGVMTKLHSGANPGAVGPWSEMPHSGKSGFGEGPQSGRAQGGRGWSSPEQTQLAEVLKVKEVKDATIIHSPPFDVQNEQFGQFDVSGVPVQPIRAPRQETQQIDPWPHNVAESPVHDAAVRNHFDSDHEPHSNQGQSETGHGTGLEDVVPEDRLIVKDERHQAQDSQSHANISPDVPHSLSLHQFQNEQGWLPMVTSEDQESQPPSPPAQPAERDAHKRS